MMKHPLLLPLLFLLGETQLNFQYLVQGFLEGMINQNISFTSCLLPSNPSLLYFQNAVSDIQSFQFQNAMADLYYGTQGIYTSLDDCYGFMNNVGSLKLYM